MANGRLASFSDSVRLMGAPGFRSLKADALKAVLIRRLGYVEHKDQGKGAHSKLVCEGRPRIIWGFGSRELAPHEVKRFLVKQVQLSVEEAAELMSHA